MSWERQSAGRLEAPSRPSSPAALGDLGERCKEGARRVGDRLAAARPGSDEARYLAVLKGARSNAAQRIPRTRFTKCDR